MAQLYDNRLVKRLPSFSLTQLEKHFLGNNTKEQLLKQLKEKYGTKHL